MQLMIDINQETPDALRLASRFLAEHATLREVLLGAAPAVLPETATPAHLNADFDLNDLARAQQEMHREPPRDPRNNPFRGHTDATPFVMPSPVPFVPPAPIAPVLGVPVAIPLAPYATAPIVVQPVVPGAAAVPAVTSMVPPAVAGAIMPEEFDASGVPFDARIHQKSKNKKRDGTWKIQKGIDAVMVSAVMQELAPHIRGTAPVSLPAPQSGPNLASLAPQFSAPPVMPLQMPSVNVPIPTFEQTPLPVGAPAPVPLPGAPSSPSTIAYSAHTHGQTQGQTGVPQQAQGQAAQAPLDPFRILARKIIEARNTNRLTAEEVTQALADAGAPSLQLLNNMPHLIPAVDANIDVLLATR